MKTVYLLHGFCGSGKTTYAKKLETETCAVRFSPDEWMTDLYGTNPPVELYTEYDSRINKVILKIAAQILKQNGDVILDLGLWTRSARDEARRWAKEKQATSKLLFFDTPEHLMKERVLKRTAAQEEGQVFIDKNALEIFKLNFEALDDDEEHEVIKHPH